MWCGARSCTPLSNAKVTAAEWLEEWRASHSLHKRPTTLVRDESAIRRHLVPRLGDIQLAKLVGAHDPRGAVVAITARVRVGATHHGEWSARRQEGP